MFTRMQEISARFPDREVFGCGYYMRQMAQLGLDPFSYFESLLRNTSYTMVDRAQVFCCAFFLCWFTSSSSAEELKMRPVIAS